MFQPRPILFSLLLLILCAQAALGHEQPAQFVCCGTQLVSRNIQLGISSSSGKETALLIPVVCASPTRHLQLQGEHTLC